MWAWHLKLLPCSPGTCCLSLGLSSVLNVLALEVGLGQVGASYPWRFVFLAAFKPKVPDVSGIIGVVGKSVVFGYWEVDFPHHPPPFFSFLNLPGKAKSGKGKD